MADDNCIFCKIVSGNIPCYKIEENALILSFLDINPVNHGHVLVIPKQHFQTFDQCSEDVVFGIAEAVQRISRAAVAATDADGYNVLCNNHAAAGQIVNHVHFHIIPRFNGDGIMKHWPAGQYENSQAEEILQKIQDKL